MKKIAIIVGSGGQDGTLLSAKLESLNYNVIGIKRGEIDLLNSNEISNLIQKAKPDEIYFLAAYHISSQDQVNYDSELFNKSININAISVSNFLEAIFNYKKNCRFFYASSCLIFKAHLLSPGWSSF